MEYSAHSQEKLYVIRSRITTHTMQGGLNVNLLALYSDVRIMPQAGRAHFEYITVWDFLFADAIPTMSGNTEENCR